MNDEDSRNPPLSRLINYKNKHSHSEKIKIIIRYL